MGFAVKVSFPVGYCTMDLQSVQTKLIQTVNSLGPGDGSVQVDWGTSSQSEERRSEPGAGVEFSTAVDALQWRSAHLANGAPGTAGVPPEVYAKRLRAMATKINHLSAEQERSIAEMQTIQAQLHQLSPRLVGAGYALPKLDLRQASLAAAEVDSQGNILLSHRTVASGASQLTSPSPGNEPSSQLAAQLRATYGAPPLRRRGWRALLAETSTLGQEPSRLLTGLGLGAWQLAQEVVRVLGASQSSTSGGRGFPQGAIPVLTPVDGILWFGGGVIGRLALNLLLAAFPGLWSVAVAAITAVTAYALYRATLTPKLAFGPVIRVFLLVAGLVVGGQL